MAEKERWPTWPPEDTKRADVTKILTEEYQDHGEWARHYSVVRMTLGTFALTGAIGIIYNSWDKPRDWATAILGGITLFIGILVFGYFTWLTFKKMNDQIEIVNAYRTVIAPTAERIPSRTKWGIGEGFILSLGAAGVYAIALYLWGQHSAPVKDPVKASQPSSQYVIALSAVHQTKHGREAHTFLINQSTGDVWQMDCAPDGTVTFKKQIRTGEASPTKSSDH